jgi:hypothetical protein
MLIAEPSICQTNLLWNIAYYEEGSILINLSNETSQSKNLLFLKKQI